MPARIDLTNQRIGNLLVLEPGPNKGSGRTTWQCLCDCGNFCVIGTKELRNGDTRSCGCLRDKVLTPDMIGEKFGRLTVTERYNGDKPYDGSFWICECECGNVITTSGKRLRSGQTQSCGCISSKGEEQVSLLLQKAQLNFVRQYTFKDCLTENGHPCRFDFAIIKDNKLCYLIEYDGIQHFEDSNWDLNKNKMRDKIKTDYCYTHNIPLIRIPYTQLEKLTIDDLILERSRFICIRHM